MFMLSFRCFNRLEIKHWKVGYWCQAVGVTVGHDFLRAKCTKSDKRVFKRGENSLKESKGLVWRITLRSFDYLNFCSNKVIAVKLVFISFVGNVYILFTVLCLWSIFAQLLMTWTLTLPSSFVERTSTNTTQL